MSKEVKGTEGIEEVKTTVVNPNAINFSDVRVENTLKFKPRAELGNLCVGKLTKIEIIETQVPQFSEEGIENTWEYAGHIIPRLVLTFNQIPTKTDPHERVYKQEYKVITNVDKNGIEVDPKNVLKQYKDMFTHIKHICNAFIGTVNYSESVAKISDIVIDPTADVASRIVAFKGFLNYFVTLLGGKDGKGVYGSSELWMKLIADYSKGTFIAFPKFVGEGFIERVIAGRNPAIEIKPSETIELTAAKGKTKAASIKGAAAEAAGSDSEIDDLLAKYNTK